MKKRRVDSVKLDGTSITTNSAGFLTCKVLAAQSGVFPYLQWDGTIQYELKHPDDLLKPEVVDQLKAMPITDTHPWNLVKLENAKDLVKGLTSDTEASVEDEKFLATRATFFDASLIGQVVTETKSQCSLGFECELVDEVGIFEGQPYTKKQTNFRLNHLAMVEEGRCGPECSAVLGDSPDKDIAIQLRADDARLRKGDGELKTIKIDGKDVQVADEVFTYIQELDGKRDAAVREQGRIQGQLDAAKDANGLLTTENQTLKANQMDSKKLDQMVQDRMQLVSDAENVFELDSTGLDGKTNREVKVACIQAVDESFKDTGKSDEYVDARYDGIRDALIRQNSSSVGDNNLKNLPNANGNNKFDVDKAQDARRNLYRSRDSKK